MKKISGSNEPVKQAGNESSASMGEDMASRLIQAEKHLKKAYPSHYEVLKLRFLAADDPALKYASTEKVANLHGVTKQRTHQKQEKAIGILSLDFFSRYSPRTVFDFVCQGQERDYITYDDIAAVFESPHAAKLLTFLMFFGLPEGEIKSDSKTYAIYDSKKTTLEELVEKGLSRIPNFFLHDYLSSLNQFEKALVELNFRPIGTGFVKRFTTKFDIIEDYICRYFKDGYRVASEEDFQKLKSLIEKDYGTFKFPSHHNVNASYSRMTRLMLCGHGVRKPKPEGGSLDEGILARIRQYLLDNQPLVFYQTIYGRFEKELSAIGIDSWYALKGALDDHLQTPFKVTRNGVRIDRPDVSINLEIVREWIGKIKGIFTADDVRKGIEAFLHVKDFVIYNYIRSATDECRILQLSGNRFIRIEECGISEEDALKLEKFVQKSLSRSKYGYISGENLLKSLRENPELSRAFSLIDDGWTLVRYIRLNFGGRFSFTSHCVGKKDISLPRNVNERIFQYAAENDVVDYKGLADLCHEVGYKLFTIPYLEGTLGPEYVRISEFIFVKFKNLPKNIISELEKVLVSHFTRTNTTILTSQDLTVEFIFALPRLRYPWTIYLFTSLCKRLPKEHFKVVLNTKSHLHQLIYTK